MLFSLHIQVGHKLVGMSPASYFEHVTGLSRMTYQRGRAYEALIASREQIESHTDSLLLRMMQKRGATDSEFLAWMDGMPSGISALMVYGMGLLGTDCAPATREGFSYRISDVP